MTLDEALRFWETFWVEKGEGEGEGEEGGWPVLLDVETIPGWVIALRPGRRPHVEIWWQEDFIREMEIYQEMLCEQSAERIN